MLLRPRGRHGALTFIANIAPEKMETAQVLTHLAGAGHGASNRTTHTIPTHIHVYIHTYIHTYVHTIIHMQTL